MNLTVGGGPAGAALLIRITEYSRPSPALGNGSPPGRRSPRTAGAAPRASRLRPPKGNASLTDDPRFLPRHRTRWQLLDACQSSIVIDKLSSRRPIADLSRKRLCFRRRFDEGVGIPGLSDHRPHREGNCAFPLRRSEARADAQQDGLERADPGHLRHSRHQRTEAEAIQHHCPPHVHRAVPQKSKRGQEALLRRSDRCRRIAAPDAAAPRRSAPARHRRP